jgi:hypothetical protein
MTNAYGWLERPAHAADGSGYAVVPVGSTFYFTGTPLNSYGYSNGYGNYEFYLVKRGSVGRTPSIYDADLHLGYSIPVNVVDINLGVDIFNLINTQRTLARDQRRDTTQGPLDANGNDTAGPPNPNYLQPVSWTGRRAIRVFGRITF